MAHDGHQRDAGPHREPQLCGQSQAAHHGRPVGGSFHVAAVDTAMPWQLSCEVLEQEAEDRRHRRINRHATGVPAALGQDLGNLRARPSPPGAAAATGPAGQGSFVTRGVNVLAFSMPGTGKTLAKSLRPGPRAWWLPDIGPSSSHGGLAVWYEGLLAAKRVSGPAPPAAQARQLRRSCSWNLGYLPQGGEGPRSSSPSSPNATERRSFGISSNLVFSERERIFASPMATVAATDRVVHHSVIRV